MRRRAVSVWARSFTGFRIQSAGYAFRSLNGWKRRDAEDAEKRTTNESLYGFRISALQIKGMGKPASDATSVVAELRTVI